MKVEGADGVDGFGSMLKLRRQTTVHTDLTLQRFGI